MRAVAVTLLLIPAALGTAPAPAGGDNNTAGGGATTDAPIITDHCDSGFELKQPDGFRVINATGDALTSWDNLKAWCETESQNNQGNCDGAWAHSSSWACKCCELKCCVPVGSQTTSAPAKSGGAGSPPAGNGTGGGTTDAPVKPSTGGTTDAPASSGGSPATTGAPVKLTTRAPRAAGTPLPVDAGDRSSLDPVCGAGYKSTATECCTCWAGYKLDSSNSYCSECAEGYARSGGFGGEPFICTNGQDGSDCADGLEPPFGCGSTGGQCSVTGTGYMNRGRKVFPCKSCPTPSGGTAKLSTESSCQFYERNTDGSVKGDVSPSNGGNNDVKGGCMPKGPRMVAPFPYAPATDSKFSLVVLGCDIATTDRFLVIPSFDLSDPAAPKEKMCEDINNPTPVTKIFNAATGQEQKMVTSADTAGWECDGCAVNSNNGAEGLTEITIKDILYDTKGDGKSPLGECACAAGTIQGRHAQPLQGYVSMMRGESETCPCDILRQYRKICRWEGTRKDSQGQDVDLWRTIDAHTVGGFPGKEGPSRTKDFAVSNGFYDDEDPQIRGAAAAAQGDQSDKEEDNCCEGLNLGSDVDGPCIPLWLFLIIWLLLCCLLALLAFMLHKNMTDIEAEKNNLKFSNFTTDKELEDVAQAEGDDDDI